jgi:hypothetical protein
MRVYPYVLFIIVIFLISCEKSINLIPEKGVPALVVEATIENGQPPIVVLSTSLDYFGKIDSQVLESSFVHDAIIEISEGGLKQQLKEFTIKGKGSDQYFYTIDTASPRPFLGQLGKSYTLTISTGQKNYRATTSIPKLAKTIDSLWWEPVPFNTDTSLARLMVKVTDPPGYGNYIRYFTKVNKEPFWPGLNSVFDDQIIDGKTYNVQVDRGVNRNEKLDLENFNFFKRGDTVAFKFCNIDKATFDFWRTMEYSYASIGNPFSSPAKVLGNISGGALGYFGGYACQTSFLIIPR